jgi:hypothetical protein
MVTGTKETGMEQLLILIAICAPLLIVVGWASGHED